MESLIEPNIHPLLVHFAIALTMTAALAYVLALVPAASRWRASLAPAADWMLAFAALAVVATVAAGFQAYYAVAHDAPSHAAMTTHRNWAVPTGAAILVLAAWRWFRRASPPSALFSTFIVAGAVLIAVTGWWGGRLVFAHGLGVASLPQAEGEGHDHDRAAGEAHEPDAAAPRETAAPGTPEATVDAFAAALRSGDAAAVERLMAPDVVVAESGGVERSFAEYAGHHMPADMAFTAAVRFTLEQRDVIAGDDIATVISRSQAHGEFQGQTIHSRMMETIMLRRIDGQWRIVHIHWSSAPITGEHEH
ncbi:MAG: nuclear transport factor 2 family protein [Caulobacteraceae bacterium]